MLTDLAFVILPASCILPMLNYSRASTHLKPANKTLEQQQWMLLFQNHNFFFVF